MNEKITKTELIWPGKRTKIESVELPFQTIEMINLPRSRRQEGLFESKDDSEWKNRLIWGDNFLVIGSLLKEFAGKINLIYIDPPFATGQDFSYQVKIGDTEWTKEPSAIEELAYRDTWGKGLESYLQMMYDRLVLMKELLADDGSIYVHLDYHVGHYVKMIMDEVFGKENLVNEIIWHYFMGGKGEKQLSRKHDIVLFYVKGSDYTFHALETERMLPKKPSLGSHKNIEQRDGVWYSTVKLDDVWDMSGVFNMSNEFTDYPTQKPKSLLKRIFEISTNEGDLVADFFCGSGTTGLAAEEMNRKWIMSDLGRYAVNLSRKRLLDIPNCKPFEVQNLGKYERHRWVKMNGSFKNYIKFILELYKAEPIEGYENLHGKKGQDFVRVGAVDAPVTLTEIQETLKECKKNKIKNLDVLGWEWEMGLHDLVRDEAERFGVKLKTLQIPREVMQVDAKTKEEVKFYELAYLKVKTGKMGKKKIIVNLEDFILENPELIPGEVREKIKNWSDFIDYWAVDWLFDQHKEKTEKDDIFHNMDQEFRTRKNPKLNLSMSHEYPKSGKYKILVKVIDIFGNDTTKLVEVKV